MGFLQIMNGFKPKHFLFLFFVSIIISNSLAAQEVPIVTFSPEKGLNITTSDGFMSFKIGTRIQQQVFGIVPLDGNQPFDGDLIIRRARAYMSGYIFNQKLGYFLQLEMDKGNVQLSNAEYRWRPNSETQINFGQLRPPSGRQFQTISKNLQMVDRSAVSRFFAVGYDLGITANTFVGLGNSVGFIVYGGITHGEGINKAKASGGLAYTGRVDILPFGKFSNHGDYIESDLYREQTPKLSVGVAFYHNQDAATKLGSTAWNNNSASISNFYIDGVFKYKGLFLLGEFIQRTISDDGILTLPDNSMIYSSLVGGKGFSFQAGKFLNEELESTIRVTYLDPDDELRAVKNNFTEQRKYGVGLNYFFIGHAIKIQSEANLVSEKYATSDEHSYVEILAQFSLSF